MDSLTLFSGTKNASSWAMRAWLALREAEIDFTEEVVDIRKPQRFPNLARIAEISPARCVPVLIVNGTAIFDSLAIMEYANDVADGRLLPVDHVLRARARSLLAWQHAGLSGICSKISFESAFYPIKRRLNCKELGECGTLFETLEKFLEASSGPYLFGSVGLADLALVPALVRILSHEYSLAGFPKCLKWAHELVERKSVEEWMREADPLPHIWFDDYLDVEGAQYPD